MSTSRSVGCHSPYGHASSVEISRASMALTPVMTRHGDCVLSRTSLLCSSNRVCQPQRLLCTCHFVSRFLWSPSWHRNLRVARALARARLRFSVPEELCPQQSAFDLPAVRVCSIITAVKLWGQWLIGSKSASEGFSLTILSSPPRRRRRRPKTAWSACRAVFQRLARRSRQLSG